MLKLLCKVAPTEKSLKAYRGEQAVLRNLEDRLGRIAQAIAVALRVKDGTLAAEKKLRTRRDATTARLQAAVGHRKPSSHDPARIRAMSF